MMTIIWGGPVLRILRHFRIGKQIRVDEPDKHFTKMGTPTMGGIMIIIPVALITVLLNAASLIGIENPGPIGTCAITCHAQLCRAGRRPNDWEGIRGKRKGEGMRARTKFIAQLILAIGFALVLKYMLKSS